MKMRYLIALSTMFISTTYSFQLIFLDETHPVYKDSTNLMLEHALTDFQYYYAAANTTSGFDFAAEPTYRYLNVIHGSADINMGGLFMQARAHYKKFWIKANTLLGGISESFDAIDYPESQHHNKSSFGGFDDLTLEVGYDFYQVPQWGGHCSIFLLSGIPVNGKAEKGCSSCTHVKNPLVTTDTVRLGTGFYRLGAGLQASAIFYCRENGLKILTMFTGFQWNYVFPTNLHQLHTSKITASPIEINVHIKPGNEFSIWDALNINYYAWDFELGVTAQGWGDFGGHFDINYDGQRKGSIKNELNDKAPRNVRNSVTPYFACSYGKTINGNPYTLGLGIAYEFDNTDFEVYSASREHAYKNFQGVNIWGNATYSF